MPEISLLPTLNATLNLISIFFLVAGRRAVKRGDIGGHWRNMTAALCVSALFLGSYLYYHALVGSVKYEGVGWARALYLLILVPHILLAALQVPFILAAVATALRARFDVHRRITRILWPVWLYVSVTGVLVYLLLYIFPHGSPS